MSELSALVHHTANRIAAYREGVGLRPVVADLDLDAVRAAIGGPLPDHGRPAREVVDDLVAHLEPALVGTTGPRYFGFVIGGALDAATCADLLATGWDQPAFNLVTSPAAALAEEAAGAWLKDLLCLPPSASFGFVTGAQGANTVALAAARHHVLAAAGWNVEVDGLLGAPRVRVVASEERHATVDRSLRLLGLGTGAVQAVPADANGAIDAAALAAALAEAPSTPTIVCAQSGNVNTGACDDLTTVCDAAQEHSAWVHVDGAFGLWAGASPRHRHLVEGVERADSWAADGHKWLNVPYDSGYVFCAHPDAHLAAMSFTAAYLVGHGSGPVRAPSDYVSESSRRARGFATWAALQELGRRGVSELVGRNCDLARRFADRLGELDGVVVANDVVLNQVLVGFGDDDRTDAVIAEVQQDGTCWMGGTTWHGQRLMRISVSNWTTTEDDVDASVDAIVRAMR
jgi:glutamate/tyrosine decarboxylase-like PLP-dependent enzyme